MRTYFYALLILLFCNTSLFAQSGIQRNYLDSINYIEVPIPTINNTDDDRRDSVIRAQEAEAYQAWLIAFERTRTTVISATNRLACATDSLALVSFYNSTNGASWATTWDLNQPVDTWYGVSLNGNGCVEMLQLEYNNLSGSLPAEIGNLSSLANLYLSGNQLTGALPENLKNLASLEYLAIGGNQLSGTLPAWIGDLSNLKEMLLYDNQFTGPIPDEIGNLAQLNYLNISYNQFTSIPTTIDNLTNLSGLIMAYNSITALPTSMGNLTGLTSLVLTGHQLGSLPSWISNLVNLNYLDIGDNNLTTFPSELQNLTQLNRLYMSNNTISTIPNWISSLDLVILSINYNKISTLPDALGDIPFLELLFVNGNQLSSLPDFTTYPNLNRLSVRNNYLSFDDLLPNTNYFQESYNYEPQNPFGSSQIINVTEGATHTISFDIDTGISNNEYNWYKDGTFLLPTTTPNLDVIGFSLSDVGIYTCIVTNPDLPELTLESESVFLKIQIDPNAPHPNDECIEAVTLTMGESVCSAPTTGYTIGAETQAGEQIPPINSGTVWYQFIVPNSGVFGMDLSMTPPTTRYNEVWATFYTGDCSTLNHQWDFQVGFGESFSEVLDFANPGDVIYLKLAAVNEEMNPDFFSICVYDRLCKPSNIGWTELQSCDSDNEFFLDVRIYQFGSMNTMIFKSDNNPDVVIAKSDYDYFDNYRVGPFLKSQQNMLFVHNDQEEACFDTLYLNSSLQVDNTTNYRPCNAIDLTSSIGSTYAYTEGATYNNPLACYPTVPTGYCNRSGNWQDNSHHSGSDWFSFVAPVEGGIKIEMNQNARRIAVWEVDDCEAILNGVPTLVNAFQNCHSDPDYSITLACLEVGKTYYLQVTGTYSNYDISLSPIALPCSMTNDMATAAISVAVQDELCTTYQAFTNIGATDSRNDPNAPDYLSNYEHDVWFRAEVPSSGNLAININTLESSDFGLTAHLFSGTTTSLSSIQNKSTYVQEVATSLFFQNLPVGDSVYIALDYNNNGNAGYFELCLTNPPCVPPVVYTNETFLSCEDPNQYYIDLMITDLPASPSYSIINVNTGLTYYQDITSEGEYRIGPFNNQEDITIAIENDVYAICNQTLLISGQAYTEISNYQPCSAIDLGGSFGGTYDYMLGDLANIELNCVAQVPKGNCETNGYWQENTNSNGSEWFKWTAITDERVALTVTALEYNYGLQVAIWETDDCSELLGGAPTLLDAFESCSDAPIVMNLPCLSTGKTYYLQISNSYQDYSITLENTDLACSLPNDTSYDAIGISVESGFCTPSTTYFNVGATDSQNDNNAPYGLLNYGNDVWFKTKVPASGNLAVTVQSVDNANFRSLINVFNGNTELLVHLEAEYIRWNGPEQTAFFNNLLPGDSIYIAMDYKDNNDNTGYFNLCLSDPPCKPAEWTFDDLILYCDNTEQHFVDLTILDVGNNVPFSIIDPYAGTIFHENLTSTGVYRLGPFDINNFGAFQIVGENSQCNTEPLGLPAPHYSAGSPPNDHMCDAINLNPIINGNVQSFTGENANKEECEPIVPIGQGCDSETGWEYENPATTWTYFDAMSNNMKLSVFTDPNEFVNVAIWKAASCEELKSGSATLIYAIQPCSYEQDIVIDLLDLEFNQRYYVEVANWPDYELKLEVPCDDEYLSVPVLEKQSYHAEKTLSSTAVIDAAPAYYRAGESITLEPGFSVEDGEFIATIQLCSLSPIVPIQAPLPPQAKLATTAIEKEISLKIVPNPMRTNAAVQFYLPEASAVQVLIFNSNGQLLTQQKGMEHKGWQSTQLDVSQLPAGVYFIGLQTDTGRLMEKVIVTR